MTEKINDILYLHKSKVRFAGAKNHIVKKVSSIKNNTKPNPQKLFVLEGIWAFNMAIRSNIRIDTFVICSECIHSNEAFELAKKFCEISEKISVVSKKVMLTICDRDEPDGLMAIAYFPRYELSDINCNESVIVVLDGLEIPGNIGTIIRSCDASKVDAVFICNRRARLTHPKLIKGSMGAAFYKPIIEFDSIDDCKSWLIKNGFSIYLADTRASKDYHEYDYAGNTAVIMGSERYGIHKEWYDGDVNMLSIPMSGLCDSLNVAIATTVILYEIRYKKSIN